MKRDYRALKLVKELSKQFRKKVNQNLRNNIFNISSLNNQKNFK